MILPIFPLTNLAARRTPTINITGAIGSMQQVQCSINLSDTNGWSVLSHVRLDASPKAFFDTAATGPQRIYRTLQVPVSDTNLVWIPPGTFLMGSPETEEGRSTNEGPQTVITFAQGFFMGRFEVTYRDWLQFLTDPNGESHLPDYLKLPMHNMSWGEATNYCRLRTLSELAAGKIPAGWAYRLPSEAEWEYSCRAGSATVFSHGNQLRSDDIRQDANFDATVPYPAGTTVVNPKEPYPIVPVGSYRANAFGLSDMHGNIHEWCWDGPGLGLSTALPYSGGSVTNPIVNTSGNLRYVRGGGFHFTGGSSRSASRLVRVLGAHIEVGFRVVLAAAGP